MHGFDVPHPLVSCTVTGPLPPNCEFVVNLAPELVEIILETKYLEKLGFHVPDNARNVALQEEKFMLCQEGLNRILKRYHQVLGSLNPPEVLGPLPHTDSHNYLYLLATRLNSWRSRSRHCRGPLSLVARDSTGTHWVSKTTRPSVNRCVASIRRLCGILVHFTCAGKYM